MLATLPAYQGLGTGKSLLNYITQQVDKNNNSSGLALDTENKNNIGLINILAFN